MDQRRSAWIFRTLLSCATLALVVAAVWNFQDRQSFRLPDDGVYWVDTPHGVQALHVEPDGPGDKGGVKPGDLLVRMNGVAVANAVQAVRLLSGIGIWNRAAYSLLRNGRPFDARLVVGMADRLRAVDYFQFLLAIFYLAIGGFVYWRRSQSAGSNRAAPTPPMVRHFYVFCLASFVLYAFSYSGRLDGFDRFIYWGDVWATLLAPAALWHFCVIFPGSGQASRLRKTLAAAGYVPVVVMLAAYHLAAAGVLSSHLALQELSGLLDRLEYALLGIYLIAGACFLYFSGQRDEDTALRQQRRWLAHGTLWGALPFVVFWLAPFVAGQIPGPTRSLSIFSLALIPLAFAYAIARYRLMDVEVFVRRGTAYTLATATLLAVFYGMVFLLSGVFQPQLEDLGPSSWVVSVVAAALLFHPLRNWIQQSLDRRFYRERYDYRRTLIDFATELGTATNPERMLVAVRQRLVETLDVRRMAIFLAGEAGASEPRYRLAEGFGLSDDSGRPIEPGALSSNGGGGLDLSFLEPLTIDSSRPYIFFESPRWRIEQPAAARRTIANLDLNYFVPCRVHGRAVAVLGLGRTADGDYLTSEDLSLVQAVSGYFAIAAENARLYHSLELKATQYERLKDYNENIVESLHVGILAADLDDRVESWSTPLELMFHISRQQAVGRRLADLLPPELVSEFDRVRGESGIYNIYKFRLRAASFPAEFRPTNGSADQEHTINLAVAPLVSKNLEAIGRLIIFDDVTERVELEEKVAQADRLSSIGILAAGVAHEVNTPLAVISSYAQMLAKQLQSDPGQSKILQKITSQTFRASEIINSLLSFSRTSSREFERIDLNQTLRDTVTLLEPQLRTAGVEVETGLDPEAAPVWGNAGKLQQVFLNLVLNARDAMPQGGRLTVRTAVGEAEDGEPLAQVEVSDTGSGIAPEHLKRIYDPFFTTKGPKHGTGLGLAVSYGIIQEHSGTMNVQSELGRGTTFRIDLPLSRKPLHA
jgi:two-component system, NtrC family, sensor kinase